MVRFRFVWLVCWAAAGLVHADALFESESVLEFSLSGPFDSMLADKKIGRPRSFKLSYDGKDYDVSANRHGVSRLELCEFPPLLLRFDRATPGVAPMTTAHALRLVTHCRHRDSSEQDLLEEYAAHKIWNVLTEAGYRVRLAHITYTDPDRSGRQYPFTRYAFLLESREQFEQRIGVRRVKLPHVVKNKLDAQHSALMYVFQYLIGNTDWSLVTAEEATVCCHNGTLFERDEKLLFVPYDFDFSGLVNAPYAHPNRRLRIKRVTQRLYRGYCTERQILRDALEEVLAHERDIMAVLHDLPGLKPYSLSRDSNYLQRFFDRARKPDKLLRQFEKRCL